MKKSIKLKSDKLVLYTKVEAINNIFSFIDNTIREQFSTTKRQRNFISEKKISGKCLYFVTNVVSNT